MRCNKCGNEVKEDVTFCLKCGNNIAMQKNAVQHQQSTNMQQQTVSQQVNQQNTQQNQQNMQQSQNYIQSNNISDDKFCTVCGKRNAATSSFCEVCGNSLLPGIHETEAIGIKPIKESSKVKKISAGIIALIAVLILAFVGSGFAAYLVLFPDIETENIETAEKSVKEDDSDEGKSANGDKSDDNDKTPVSDDSDGKDEIEKTNPDEEDENINPDDNDNEGKNNEKNKVSSYACIKADITWEDASSAAQNQNGYLVSVNSVEEFDRVCQLANNAGINVFWLGAKIYPGDDWHNTKWQDGKSLNFARWLKGEPTYRSEEGNFEGYLMAFKVNGIWYFNDSENDITKYYTGKIGYIIETEE